MDPRGTTFTVGGRRAAGELELARHPATLENYMRYFLLPRRTSPDAPWILCFACDRNAFPGAAPVWEDAEAGLAILRRPS